VKSSEQEQLVARIVLELARRLEGKAGAKVGHGRNNQIAGASGFRHQIDVSAETTADLVLYECKYWGRNVGPDAVLVLAARGTDIQAAHPGKNVQLNLVINRSLSGGACQLAAYFGVQQQLMKSAEEFAVDYKGDRHIGLTDVGRGSEAVLKAAEGSD
jgi:hypothetical protein